jgi:drug/metabolite transporter (DMT)-like permease
VRGAHRGLAAACVLLSAVGFGSLSLWAKLGFRAGIDPVTLLAGRFALAAPLLLAACALRRPAALARPPGEVGLLLLQGAVGYGTPALLAFLAFRIASGAVVTALYFTFPLWVAAGTALAFRERLGGRQAAALALAVAGSALAAGLLDDSGARLPPAGVLLSLGAALSYATYVVSSQRLVGRNDPLAVAGYSMLGCAGLFVLIRAASGGPPPAVAALAAAVWPMAVLATALPLALFLVGVDRLGATRAAILAAFEPVVTALLLFAVLGERVSAGQALGILAIVAGVALVARLPGAGARAEGCR